MSARMHYGDLVAAEGLLVDVELVDVAAEVVVPGITSDVEGSVVGAGWAVDFHSDVVVTVRIEIEIISIISVDIVEPVVFCNLKGGVLLVLLLATGYDEEDVVVVWVHPTCRSSIIVDMPFVEDISPGTSLV